MILKFATEFKIEIYLIIHVTYLTTHMYEFYLFKFLLLRKVIFILYEHFYIIRNYKILLKILIFISLILLIN